MEGFEPSRPYEHHPLKMASLPFLHMAVKYKKVIRRGEQPLWPDWGSNPGPHH